MATDIKLDQNGGNWVVIEGSAVKTTAPDLMIDHPARRRAGPSSQYRRALVHDFQDGLTLNWAGDYPGGVTVAGNLAVTGDVKVGNASLAALIETLRSVEVMAGNIGARIDTLERTVEGLVQLVGAAVIPPWRTKTEVEEGDDMGMSTRSAADLGLVVEYEIDQQNPHYDHGDVISIVPSPGTLVMRGSTVKVRINLEG
jgi:hypothetical protein